MNKKLLLVFSILITISVCAQEYTTNDIESGYKFQKIVRLDASPVQSQGCLYVSENYLKYKTINIYLYKEALNSTLRKN